jgi:nucleolar protein 4
MAQQDFVDLTTLFVRGLGPAATGPGLEAHFSGVGPVRHAFVVTNEDKARCKGFGFVSYTNPDDAAAAVTHLQGSMFTGRKLKLELAKRRMRDGGRDAAAEARRAKRKEQADASDPSLPGDIPVLSPPGLDLDGGLAVKPWMKETGAARAKKVYQPSTSVAKAGALAGSLSMRTVVVRAAASKPHGTPVSEPAVLRWLNSSDPASGFESCLSANNGTELRCVFKSWPQAGKSAALVHGTEYDACIDALRGGKRCRVIVRNLPFVVNVKELKELFEKAGALRELNMPAPIVSTRNHIPKLDPAVTQGGSKGEKGGKGKKGRKEPDTSPVLAVPQTPGAIAIAALVATAAADPGAKPSAGYAFVEYFLAAHANHAIAKINGTKVGGRVIAVDLAVSKELYQAAAGKRAASDAAAAATKVASKKQEHKNELDAKKQQKAMAREARGGSSVDDDSGSSDDDDSDSDAEEALVDEDMRTEPVRKMGKSTSQEMGRSIFVRNLLFETSAAELREALSVFGDIEQAVLVVDSLSGRPRGSAFVRFRDASSAEKAIKAGGDNTMKKHVPANPSLRAAETNGVIVGGRSLLISMAVDRSKARELVAESDPKNAKKGDPRNLRLAWLGQIKPGTKDAEGMSQEDVRKRSKSEKDKRAKLSQNPNAYVSEVRLAVRNLPRDFDEKTVKHMFMAAAHEQKKKGEKKCVPPRIGHVKILRDAERNDRSKGCGFVMFEKHDAARRALEQTNNNSRACELLIGAKPKALEIDDERARLLRKQWGNDRRLIVEFAVEDRRQVRILDQVKQRGREKSAAIAAAREKCGDFDLEKKATDKNASVGGGRSGAGKRNRPASGDDVEPAYHKLAKLQKNTVKTSREAALGETTRPARQRTFKPQFAGNKRQAEGFAGGACGPAPKFGTMKNVQGPGGAKVATDNLVRAPVQRLRQVTAVTDGFDTIVDKYRSKLAKIATGPVGQSGIASAPRWFS